MSGYNLSMFNSRGKISQIENANKAVLQSNTVISIKGLNSIITMTIDSNLKKDITSQIEPKIFIINKNIVISASGLKPDIILVVSKARKFCKDFHYNYGHEISIAILTKEISNYIQSYTCSSGFRPLGVSFHLLGFEKNGPQLFEITADGKFFDLNFSSIGKSSVDILDFLKLRWSRDLSMKNILDLIFNCLNNNDLLTNRLREVIIAKIDIESQVRIISKQKLP